MVQTTDWRGSGDSRIHFHCNGCGAAVNAARNAAGKAGHCPRCARVLPIPPGLRQAIAVPVIQGLTIDSPATGEKVAGVAEVRVAEFDPYVGRTLGSDFELQSLVGTGAAGRVYRARQISLDRTVAVKVISGADLTPRRRERFKREAVALAKLTHPHILQIHALGIDEALAWMAVEFAEGGDIAGRLEAGPAPWPIARQWLKEALSALGAAHDAGIIHRDVKPHNLMLTAHGELRLADFGLIKMLGAEQTLTQQGKRVGTPAYIAPEQIRSDDVDARTDLYSLGASFHHMLAGRLPFEGSSVQEILQGHLNRDAEPLEQAAPSAPRALCRIVSRLMEKRPELRYQSAAVALADLESYERTGAMRADDPSTEPVATETLHL